MAATATSCRWLRRSRPQAAGRTLIGIGTRPNTNRHWAKSCHEFRYYENLVEKPPALEESKADHTQTAAPAQPQLPPDPAADMLARAVRLLSETKGEAWVNKGAVWHMIKRLDSTFDPKDHGHATFAEMVKGLDRVVDLRNGGSDHMLRLR